MLCGVRFLAIHTLLVWVAQAPRTSSEKSDSRMLTTQDMAAFAVMHVKKKSFSQGSSITNVFRNHFCSLHFELVLKLVSTTVVTKQNTWGGWNNSSMVRSTCCSCRRSRFDFQHLYWLTTTYNSSSGGSDGHLQLLRHLNACNTHTYTHTDSHIPLIIYLLKFNSWKMEQLINELKNIFYLFLVWTCIFSLISYS